MSARNCSKDGNSRRRSSCQCRWWIRNNSTRSITASSSRSRCLLRHLATASSNSSSKLGCSLFGMGLLRGQEQVCDGFNLDVELPLPRLKSLTVEEAEGGMLGRCRDGQVLPVECFNQPVLQSGHGDFPSAEFVFELCAHFG